ncbi:hypothetical protein VNI00_008373 [Paramarasmius palmivorus]|uniref:Uncharacterized protein n=1 Tax=Paramarasmius palmivorus TaxID=297713 RepID=A0AAW0CYW4_9AGAR
MSSSFSPTPGELSLAGQIFALSDTQKLGILKGDEAVRIFGGAKLAPTVLGEIWNIADEDNNGWLSRKGTAIALRLMGWAQKGEKVSKDLIYKPGPLPVIEGLAPIAPQHTGLAPQHTGMSIPKSPPPGLPPLSQADKTKFHNMFLKASPTNGLLSADQARDLFLKSKLPTDTLLQIWNLADTQDRGALDATDFAIGMYFIQGVMSGTISTLPDSLPHGLYQQAAGGSPTGGSFSPSATQSTFPQSRPPIQPQYTGQTSILQPQNTGMSAQKRTAPSLPARPTASSIGSSAFGIPAPVQLQWDVTAAEKANADRYFDTLDTSKQGYIEGDVAVPFMLESKLPDDVLAHIWDLSDLSNNGRLTRDAFAVAMHLIQKKLNGGDLPETLPPSLIPPSMRTNGASPFTPLTQRPAPPPPVPQQPAPELTHDLFSFDDTPPASATSPPPGGPFSVAAHSTGTQPRSVSSPPPPQPASRDPFGSGRDLLSDDDEPVSTRELHDRSAEIGNIQNQLNSTNRSLETAKTDRGNLEQTLAEQASQLSSLQTQLSLAKAAYETETKTLAHLKERHATQAADIQKTRQELITAESDLSALRVEKAEIEGAFLRDKEEARELHKKMIEASQQAETLKAETEKAKKDAKQQKGLLAIAKKQLSSKEAERAKAEKELQEAAAEVTAITKEREDVEAELERSSSITSPVVAPSSPLADTFSISSAPDRARSPDSVAFAAAQPLPATPDLSSPVAGVSSPTGKSNNPFERLAMTGSPSPRSQSPFLPFANASVPTPPVLDSKAAEKAPEPATHDDTEEEDFFGLSKATTNGNGTASQSSPVGSDNGTPKAEPIAIPKPTPISVMPGSFGSPTETEIFATPPSTGVPLEMATEHQRQTTLDTAAAKFPEVNGTTSTSAEEKSPQASGETDIGSSLKELDVDESDTDSSDEEDEVPLAELAKRKSAELHVQPVDKKEDASFDDIFGAPSDAPEALTSGTTPSAPKEPSTDAFGLPVKDTEHVADLFGGAADPQPATVSHVASPTEAGVSAFDEAMGNMSSASTTSPSNTQPQFSFDSAFDDNFDFGAAGGTAFVPAPATNGHTPAANGDGFDSLFSSQPPVSKPVETSAVTSPAITTPTVDNTPKQQAPVLPNNNAAEPATAPPGPSFDDVFSGFGSAPSLNLEAAPASPTTATQEASTADSPARKPFPSTASPTTSPRPSVTGASSIPPRAKSPPPRTGSPKPPRPSTGSGSSIHEKEKKEPPPRHSKLSIRLPFGKKKKQQAEAPPPPPPAQMLTPPQEEPDRQGSPAGDDDVEAVKQLTAMGFSRSQAVGALERYGYDVPRALNSLLGQG